MQSLKYVMFAHSSNFIVLVFVVVVVVFAKCEYLFGLAACIRAHTILEICRYV